MPSPVARGGIDAVMEKNQLDAIVAPASGPAGETDLVYGDRGGRQFVACGGGGLS